jgi:hypothetical protein
MEKHLFQARKCYVAAERKLTYLEILLPILETADSPYRAVALSVSDPKSLDQDQILSVLRRRCQEYRKVLDELSLKIKYSNEFFNPCQPEKPRAVRP